MRQGYVHVSCEWGIVTNIDFNEGHGLNCALYFVQHYQDLGGIAQEILQECM